MSQPNIPNVEDFLKLSKKAAQNLAEKRNLLYHPIRIDKDMFYSYPTEERTDRVCIEIDNGQVTKATIK